MKSAVLYQSFFSETGLKNSREIGHFFHKFVPKNPAKFDFFFRDLPEALFKVLSHNCINKLCTFYYCMYQNSILFFNSAWTIGLTSVHSTIN